MNPSNWSTAARFVEKSTYWLRHPSGTPVRAPKFQWHLEGQDSESEECAYGWDDDWKIKFGANTFHVGRAICRCAERLDRWLDDREREGAITAPHLSNLWVDLGRIVRGSVSNYAGVYYEQYTGQDEGFPDDMVFGVQSTDVRAFRIYFLLDAGVIECFEAELKEAEILRSTV